MSNDDSPAYLRLRGVISDAILEGRYANGDALPSVRALAAEHGLNPLTVAKAYQTFQEDGLITVRRGVGMFVAPDATERLRQLERADFLDRTWPEVVRQIRILGLDVEQLLGQEMA